MDHNFPFTCVLPNGIHARPATQLEQVCRQFDCDIQLTNLRSERSGNAKSILALIGTDTLLDDSCLMTFSGDDSKQAMIAVEAYITHEFPHCDEALDTIVDDDTIVLPQSLLRHQPTLLTGKSLVLGIAKGRLVDYHTVDLNNFATAQQDNEVARFEHAFQLVRESLTHSIATASEHEKDIIKSHLAILQDVSFIDDIHQRLIHNSTANAILACTDKLTQQLQHSSSRYLRDRSLDIQDIATQLLTAAYPDQHPVATLILTQPSIVIAQDLTPSQFLGLDKNLLQGLVLTNASKTSHTIILARAFNIPTLSAITLEQCEGALNTSVYLDSNLGVLAILSNSGCRHYFARAIKLQQQQQIAQAHLATQPAQTQDGKKIEIAANIACPIEVQSAFNNGAESIGLFRTEMLFMGRSDAPSETEQFAQYCDVLAAAGEKTVIIRTMDIGGDKSLDYLNLPHEINPFLGYRAVRIYPQFLSLFHTQIRAILRATAFGHVKLMIPMIQSIEEIRWVKKQIALVKAQLRHEGIAFDENMAVGIMVEIPSVVFIMDQFCLEVDFFSIGSNDMTQYLLAVDRNNNAVAHLYNSLTPAFLCMLNQVISTAHKHGRWVGLCGELSADLNMLPLLVGAGLDEISMSAPNILNTKAALSQLDSEACQTLFQQACDCATTAEIEALLTQARRNKPSKPLLSLDCVFKHAEFHNKEDTIQAMVGNLTIAGRVKNSYKLEEDIWAREAIFSTEIGYGFAIPHTKSEHIQDSSISIAQLATPIDWGSDAGDVDFIIMLTLNQEQSEQHMRIFSSLARKLINASFREQLKSCQTDTEIITMLTVELAI